MSSPPGGVDVDESMELDLSSDDIPSSDTAPTSFSDDLEALHDTEVETKRAKNAAGVVVQHRMWQTQQVFLSSPKEASESSPLALPDMLSSPSRTPSPKKRKIGDLDLGKSTLTRPVKAQRVYYGIDIHQLLHEAQLEDSIPKIAKEVPTIPAQPVPASQKPSLLWTEKYRATKFTDLIGDERTHRSVMHWLKRWDQIVFPGSYRLKSRSKSTGGEHGPGSEDRPHRKILMLTGPPGLGKTTLAHVCAKQAGYEVQEINASDERSSAVVKGRIRDMVATENVKSVDNRALAGKTRKTAKPVCVIVDEVDGVVSGSGGGGEGGFVKALIDLVLLDQKNSSPLSTLPQGTVRKKKGDRFRLLRPLILVCNDVYHPALRPLRQSSLAEIIHVRKPAIQTLVSRLHAIFDKEGVPCESDGVRRLCEATWGVSNRKEDRNGSGAGEGDMRGIMVVGEWVAGKLRASGDPNDRLTRKWIEENILRDLSHGGGGTRGLGRGGPKDIVERVFQEGAGFPKSSVLATPQQGGNTSVKGVAEGSRRTATERLRELIDTHGDTDRIATDCFSSYPERTFQDDNYLSKPDAAYAWLHFHDRLSRAVYNSSEWELAPYLSAPILAFHHLFASPTRAQYQNTTFNDTENTEQPHPFAGPGASWAAHEAEKQNTAHMNTLRTSLSLPLYRLFGSASSIATDLNPYLLRMLSPSVNPVVVGGSGQEKGTASVRKSSEQTLIQRAVNAMGATGVRLERVRLNQDDSSSSSTFNAYASQQWIWRMEPPLDALCCFETGPTVSSEKTRYAVRQVLAQEWAKEEARIGEQARLARFGVTALDGSTSLSASGVKRGGPVDGHDEALGSKKRVKRDFFGRPITMESGNDASSDRQSRPHGSGGGEKDDENGHGDGKEARRVWVAYHEGYSNAVRKPITLAEFMRGL